MSDIKLWTENAQNLYHAANALMADLGAEGSVDTDNNLAAELMDVLTKIDGGTYISSFEGESAQKFCDHRFSKLIGEPEKCMLCGVEQPTQSEVEA